MKILRKAGRGVVAIMFCAGMISARTADAFGIWPVADAPQFGAFGASLQDGITKVNTFKGQIEEHIKTIHTVGDNITAYLKYADYAKPFMKYLPEDLRQKAQNVLDLNMTTVDDLTASMDLMDGVNDNSWQVTNDVTNGVGNIINTDYDELKNQEGEEINDAANEAVENEINNMVASAEQETLKAFNDSFDTIVGSNTTEVLEYTTATGSYLTELTGYVQNNKNLSDEELQDYMQRIDETQRKTDHLQDNAERIEDEAKTEFNHAVSAAYDEFDVMLQKFYKGEISKEELTTAGEKLKEDVKNAGERIKEETIKNLNNLKEELQEIREDVESLREDITNNAANSREYPDEEVPEGKQGTGAAANPEATPPVEKTSFFQGAEQHKAMFAFHSQKDLVSAKIVYEKDNAGGKYFIMPKELTECMKKKSGKPEIKLRDLEADDIITKLRENMVCAKMEKTFWCDKPEDKNCTPYITANWKKYQENGVYEHMQEDYLAGGNVMRNKAKQYSLSWGDTENQDSVISKLNKKIQQGSNDARKAYGVMGEVNLETAKLWSWVRRVDATDRAANVIDRFKQEKGKLYLGVKNSADGDEEVVQNANDQKLGSIKPETEEAGEDEKKSVFSDVFLYACRMNEDNNDDNLKIKDIKAEDISVAENDKYDETKIKEAEDKIVKCLSKFSEAANRGTIYGCPAVSGNKEADAKIWRDYQTMVLHDTAFQTFYLSVLNNHKSAKDLKRKDANSTDATIISLQDGLKDAEVARDDYAANAEINNYVNGQILDVIDADAQNIQTEILEDLPKLGYGAFGKPIPLKGKEECEKN